MGESKRRKQRDPYYGSKAHWDGHPLDASKRLEQVADEIARDLSPENIASRQLCYLMLKPEAQEIKVGIAVDPAQRRNQLQSGSSEKILLIGYWIPTSSAAFLESELHSLLSDFKSRGEWFKICSALWQRIESYMGAPGKRSEWIGPKNIESACQGFIDAV